MADLQAYDVISRARAMLNDSTGSVDQLRWNSAVLRWYLNAGIVDLFGRRPDVKLRPDMTLRAVPEMPAVEDESDEDPANHRMQEHAVLDCDGRWTMALADYVAYRCLGEDDADSGSAEKAEAHLQAYLKQVYE